MITQTRQYFGTGLLGLLILGSLIWYMSVTPAPGYVPTPETQEYSITEPEQVLETSDYYEIDVSFPKQTPLIATAGVQADLLATTRLAQFVEDYVETFKREGGFATLTPEDISMFGYDRGRKQALTLSYELFTSPHTVSYAYTAYVDTLGAHPNTYFQTFTFDMKTGEELLLADLFLPESPYLEILSDISRSELLITLGDSVDADYVIDGTMPVTSNFSHFVLENNHLVLMFAPYQVGPYALGAQEVRILLNVLNQYLKPEYRI